MLDPKYIRTETDVVADLLLKKRGFALDTASIKTLEENRKSLQIKTESLQI